MISKENVFKSLEDAKNGLEYLTRLGMPISQQQNPQPAPVQSPSGAILITPQNIQEVQGRDMRITVNGKVFQERNAIQTFIEALKFIGLDEVAKVGIMSLAIIW